MANNITSANATAVMRVAELYPMGFTLSHFATDTALAQDEDTIAETRMGVDGHMSAGFTPSIQTVNISLEPGSPSIEYLNNVYLATQKNRKTYETTLVITIPSTGQVFTYTGGVMQKAKMLPDIKKVLDPVTYSFAFEYRDISS